MGHVRGRGLFEGGFTVMVITFLNLSYLQDSH